MIDLAALFQEASEELSGSSFPAFPVSRKGQPERQGVEVKNISGISGVSGNAKRVNELSAENPAQARVGAGASERARDVPAEAPETPETPEKPAPAMGWLSGSSLGKPEKERETGKLTALPGAPAAAALDFEERAAFLEYECGLSRSSAELQAHAEIRRAETAPPVRRPMLDGLPSVDGLPLWLAGLAALSPVDPPCPGYRVAERSGEPSEEWPRTLARAVAFCEQFGAQAEALGWTASRLFGVHPTAGIVRVDHCGALALPGSGTVRAITATEISFGHLTYREKPGQPQGVPIWEAGR